MDTEDRLEGIIREYGSFLRNTIARLCPRNLGIQHEDIEQEAYLRLWRAIENERDIRHPASYLYRVAVTATLDAVRRVKARREHQLVAQEDEGPRGDAEPAEVAGAGVSTLSSPSQTVHRARVLREVVRAVERLPRNRRRAVGLHLQGLRNKEVGALLGWSEAKARNLIYRGLADLRNELKASGISSSEDAVLGE